MAGFLRSLNFRHCLEPEHGRKETTEQEYPWSYLLVPSKICPCKCFPYLQIDLRACFLVCTLYFNAFGGETALFVLHCTIFSHQGAVWMRLHQLGKTHVVPVARARAQEGEIRHGQEGVGASLVPRCPPIVTRSRRTELIQHVLWVGVVRKTCSRGVATRAAIYLAFLLGHQIVFLQYPCKGAWNRIRGYFAGVYDSSPGYLQRCMTRRPHPAVGMCAGGLPSLPLETGESTNISADM